MPLRSHGDLYLYQNVGDWHQRFRDRIALTLAVQAGKTSGGNGDDGELLLPPPPGLQDRNLSLYPSASSLPRKQALCPSIWKATFASAGQATLQSNSHPRLPTGERRLQSRGDGADDGGTAAQPLTAEAAVHSAIRLHPHPRSPSWAPPP